MWFFFQQINNNNVNNSDTLWLVFSTVYIGRWIQGLLFTFLPSNVDCIQFFANFFICVFKNIFLCIRMSHYEELLLQQWIKILFKC